MFLKKKKKLETRLTTNEAERPQTKTASTSEGPHFRVWIARANQLAHQMVMLSELQNSRAVRRIRVGRHRTRSPLEKRAHLSKQKAANKKQKGVKQKGVTCRVPVTISNDTKPFKSTQD